MIVEDETIVAMALQEMVERIGYHVIDSVLSGEDAVRKTLDLHPDLILMDIKLKGAIDGIDAAKQILKMVDIPIIYLTAYGDEDTVQRAKQTEPFAYIIKPFNEFSLRSSIEIALYQHKLKQKLQETTQHLENIINNISDILFSVNEKNHITIWNNAAEHIIGYKQKELRNIPVQDIPFLENPDELRFILEKITSHEVLPASTNIRIRSKHGLKKIIHIVSSSMIYGSKEDSFEIVFVGQEVTSDCEMMETLSEGNSYLWMEKNTDYVPRFLSDVCLRNFTCLHISRSFSDSIKDKVDIKNMHHYTLRNHIRDENTAISDLDELEKTIHEFCHKNVHSLIVIQRIDYFFIKYSFEEVMTRLFQITDMVKDTHSILILHIIPEIITKRQQVILENEFISFPTNYIEKISIHQEMVHILNLLYVEKQNNHTVTFKILKERINTTYPTLSRKIQELEKKNLISVIKEGRTKIIEITKMGEKIIHR